MATALNYYDQISKSYVELHKDEQLKKIKIIKDNIFIMPNSLILDLGCGPYFSDWAHDSAGKAVKCKVIGIDSSRELLKIAEKKGIKTVLGKAESLPFDDYYFDCIFSITAMQNFDDLEKAASEIKRVLKKDGFCVITFLKKSKNAKRIEKLLRKHFNITKTLEEDKDLLFFLKQKQDKKEIKEKHNQ